MCRFLRVSATISIPCQKLIRSDWLADLVHTDGNESVQHRRQRTIGRCTDHVMKFNIFGWDLFLLFFLRFLLRQFPKNRTCRRMALPTWVNICPLHSTTTRCDFQPFCIDSIMTILHLCTTDARAIAWPNAQEMQTNDLPKIPNFMLGALQTTINSIINPWQRYLRMSLISSELFWHICCVASVSRCPKCMATPQTSYCSFHIETAKLHCYLFAIVKHMFSDTFRCKTSSICICLGYVTRYVSFWRLACKQSANAKWHIVNAIRYTTHTRQTKLFEFMTLIEVYGTHAPPPPPPAASIWAHSLLRSFSMLSPMDG